MGKRNRQSRKDRRSPAALASASPTNHKTDLAWLALAAALAFASSVPGNFVWLDHAEIEQANYRIVDAHDLRRVWHETIEQYQGRRSGVVVEQGGYFRPVYALSITLDWALWGGRPWCYHVENLLWHVAVVWLLYALGNQLFGATEEGRRVVFWATLLFAVHPLGVHSVTWISGRKDTMCAAFGVAALVAFGRVAFGQVTSERGPFQRSTRRTMLWLLLAAGCLALAIGCKELGYMVPVLAAVLFFPKFRLDGESARPQPWQTWLFGVGVLGACAAALAVYRVDVVGARGLGAKYPADSLIHNLATSTNVWWHYVARILFPYQVTLSDAWPVVRSMTALDVLSVLSAAMLAVATVYGAFRKRPWALGMLWFAIWMVPASGLVPLRHFRAERYLYPASWGVLVAALWCVLPAMTRFLAPLGQRSPAVVLTVIAIAFGLVTSQENEHWWDDARLFGHSVAQDPRHVEGRIELSRISLAREDFAETARLARQALADFSDPSYATYGVTYYAHTILGTSLVRLGQTAEAVKELQTALREMPNSPAAYADLAMAEAMSGDTALAKQHFLKSLELDPSSSATRNNLSLVLVQLGDFAEAEPHIERLIRDQPDNVSHVARLAWCQWKLGQQADALANLHRAQTKAPSNATVRQVGEMIQADTTPE
ncbi:MAG: tetratricopeptide repeat protein [Pirellulales bacterium]